MKMKIILSVAFLLASADAVQLLKHEPNKDDKDRAEKFVPTRHDRLEAANPEDGLVHEENGELIEPYSGKTVEADEDGSLFDVKSG